MSESKPTIIFLSTYPPRECGIATFTQDLLMSSQKLLGPLVECRVAALNLNPLDTYKYPKEVDWKIDQNNVSDYLNLAETINKNANVTGVIIQHEYGIFGGVEGELLLSFMKNCRKPMLVTLHTVLPNPNPKMKEVTESIISYANTVVVLTNNSKKIIETLYSRFNGKIFMVPHGIHSVAQSDPKDHKIRLQLENHIILSTFGLLGRGKGIEYVLQALPKVIKKYPSTLYLILGETHPVVRRNEGEKYRVELADLITKLKIENNVKFYDQYFSLPDLFEFLKATDIYIATSTDPNHAVSGTLSYALGTGRAAISTEFAQAKEIITPENGRLVPIKDPSALTNAILNLLGDKKRLSKMHKNAYKNTRSMMWSNVAREYLSLLGKLSVPPIKINHLIHMTDNFGLFQFARFSNPNKDSGYTLDDNTRALIVCSWLIKIGYTHKVQKLLKVYLTFIKNCQQTDGSFINYVGFGDNKPTKQNNAEDLEDAQMRALWGLSEIMTNKKISSVLRNEAKRIFLFNLRQDTKLTHLRAKALAVKSFSLALTVLPEIKPLLHAKITEYADSLLYELTKNSIKSWRWFEHDLNYNNALLPESLLIAGETLKNDEYATQGILSLQFLISKTFSKTYMPIGHAHWYKNKEKRSSYDQQPEDPASMILALDRAYRYTSKDNYRKLANICFSWFLGNNSLKKALYDYTNGGCYDGLHPDRVNLNQGAESLVSYLMSSIIITQLNEN